MPGISATSDRVHVLIAGGGFGAVETMLALHALAPERVRMTLVSTSTSLAYRPAATTESFYDAPPLAYDLEAIAADVGASFRRDRVEAVTANAHRVRLASFTHLDYDALVLAVGARATSAIPGALTFHDQSEVHHIRRVIDELSSGAIHRIVFAVPRGCSWPLPMYELALLAATRLRKLGAPGEIVLVSSEATPLHVFGADAAPLVANLLAERGVRFVGGADPQGVDRDGALVLGSGERLEADRVVALPTLHGPRITGLPADVHGFVTTDSLGGVIGLPDVYATGDMTTYPIKQGGLAAQRADLIAQRIAADAGTVATQPRPHCVLRARLVGGADPVFLRAELDELGHATAASSVHGRFNRGDSGETPEKVFGRYLVPYLRTRAPLGERAAASG